MDGNSEPGADLTVRAVMGKPHFAASSGKPGLEGRAMAATIDLDGVFTVKRWPGVAVRVYGYPQVWEPCLVLCQDDDGNEWEEEAYGEGEWADDTECGEVLVVMVGDDHKHRVAIDDLIPLGELDYCAECGQVGCQHDGRDRD